VARRAGGGSIVKPAAFDYVAPTTVDDAVAALAGTDRRVDVLAGGQSLLLELHYRRRQPDLVVDINRVADLDGLRVRDGDLVVGALARHDTFETPVPDTGPLGRQLAAAASHIAHPPIRALGTMAGSLAWAHPASEWCALAVALDARVELRGHDGTRTVPAADWFLGPHRTARRPHELITAVRLPLLDDGSGIAFLEHRRTHASFAQVAVAVTLTVADDVVTAVRIGLANAAGTPVRAHAAERALLGAPAGPAAFDLAATVASTRDADPLPEPYADVEYRRHVVDVLVGRALRLAHQDGGGR
jgi:carbon-monoxide dehydrogenase medium subunit